MKHNIIRPYIEQPDLVAIAKKQKAEEARQAKKQPKTKPKKPEQTQQSAPNKQEMIYIPSINLYIAKQRTCLGKNWYETHKEIQPKGLKMPTIPEFIEFLKYLRDNPNNENTKIYKEITEVRNPWRSEWLDADFKFENNKLCINYNHVLDSQGNLQPQNTELLEDCLMKSCCADILNLNKQGLPTRKSKNKEFYYSYPRSNNNSVAGFYAHSVGAYLVCDGYPTYAGASLGVFVCAKGAQKNSKFKIK